MQENNEIDKYIDDELVPFRIQMEQIEDTLEVVNTKLQEHSESIRKTDILITKILGGKYGK